MISLEMARALRDAGLRWRPASGDRFSIDAGDFDGEAFTISEMTAEVHEYATGRIVGFNGTTEWALDSVDLSSTLWLPREDQLRLLLGGSFRALHRKTGIGSGAGAGAGYGAGYGAGPGPERYVVEAAATATVRKFTAETAADAYAKAVLEQLRGTDDDAPSRDGVAPANERVSADDGGPPAGA